MQRLLLCVSVIVIAFAGAAEPETEVEDEGWEEGLENLERNVRLDFKAVPLEGDDRGVFVVTAARWYVTATRYEGNGFQIAFKVSGHIQIMDDGRMFLTCEGHMEFVGADEQAEFNVESSALLAPGEDFELASMGEKTLVVRASYVAERYADE